MSERFAFGVWDIAWCVYNVVNGFVLFWEELGGLRYPFELARAAPLQSDISVVFH